MSILLRRHSAVGPPPPVGDSRCSVSPSTESSAASSHRHSVVLLDPEQLTSLGVELHLPHDAAVVPDLDLIDIAVPLVVQLRLQYRALRLGGMLLQDLPQREDFTALDQLRCQHS